MAEPYCCKCGKPGTPEKPLVKVERGVWAHRWRDCCHKLDA